MIKKISINVIINGYRFNKIEVWADVIGQVGVYSEPRGWIVTHLASDTAIAGFTVKHVAYNLAHSLSLFDLDALIDPADGAMWDEDVYQYLKQRVQHPTWFCTESTKDKAA